MPMLKVCVVALAVGSNAAQTISGEHTCAVYHRVHLLLNPGSEHVCLRGLILGFHQVGIDEASERRRAR